MATATKPRSPVPVETFEYGQFSTAIQKQTKDDARAIRECSARVATAVIEIGKRLIAVRERLGCGHFLPWVEAEFGWCSRTAYNYIGIAERFGDLDCAAKFQTWALNRLSQRNTPPEAIAKAVEHARAGTFVTARLVRNILGIKSKYSPTSPEAAALRVTAALGYLADSSERLAELPIGKADELIERLVQAAVELRRATRGLDDEFWAGEGRTLLALADSRIDPRMAEGAAT